MPLPAWASDPSSLLITEEEYEALPPEVCKSIEVVDGSVIFCESPSPRHQRVLKKLTRALEDARPDSGPRIDVLPDTDMYYLEDRAVGDKAGRFTMQTFSELESV